MPDIKVSKSIFGTGCKTCKKKYSDTTYLVEKTSYRPSLIVNRAVLDRNGRPTRDEVCTVNYAIVCNQQCADDYIKRNLYYIGQRPSAFYKVLTNATVKSQDKFSITFSI